MPAPPGPLPPPLLSQVSQLIQAARQWVTHAVNAELPRTTYGKQVAAELAQQQTAAEVEACVRHQFAYIAPLPAREMQQAKSHRPVAIARLKLGCDSNPPT